MAYIIPWDESSPDGAITPAADLDVELQNLKTSIRERIEDVIPDWANDGVDPKIIPLSAIEGLDLYCCLTSTGVIPIPATKTDIPWTVAVENGGYAMSGAGVVLPADGVYFVQATFEMFHVNQGANTGINAWMTGAGIHYIHVCNLSTPAGVGASFSITQTTTGLIHSVVAGDILKFQVINTMAATYAAQLGSGIATIRQIAS